MKVTEDSGFEAWWDEHWGEFANEGNKILWHGYARMIWDAAKGDTFEPIHIVLETEGEAAWMWARLFATFPKSYDRALGIQLEDKSTDTSLWEPFNAVYDARKGKYAKGE